MRQFNFQQAIHLDLSQLGMGLCLDMYGTVRKFIISSISSNRKRGETDPIQRSTE